MSWWNHHSNLTDFVYNAFNNSPDLIGAPLPRCPDDLHQAWQDWITRGWFAWESEGYPYWGNMHHTQSWWDYRHLENILFVHYNDLLAALPDEIQRLATFLGIAITEEAIANMLPALTLESMRRERELERESKPSDRPETFRDGAKTFFFKGTNGRWKDVLSTEELALYEQAATRLLTPACRRWLEQGRVGLPVP
jgi:aryl sulfotransferase